MSAYLLQDMQFPQDLEPFLALHVVGLSLQPFILGHLCIFPSAGIIPIDGLMQQGRERDDIVGVLQPRLRDFIFVRAALRDDVMILIAAAAPPNRLTRSAIYAASLMKSP